MKTKQDKLNLLKETVDWYSEDTNRRCIINGVCKYSGVSEGCAIGRLLTPAKRKLMDSKNLGGVIADSTFKELPKELQDYGQSFLLQIQMLHDTNEYWKKSQGLTIKGRKK